MKDQLAQLTNRFMQMPRAIRWGVYAVIGIMLFLVWDTHIRPVSEELRLTAERIERNRELVRNTHELNRQIDELREVISIVGRVERPRDIETGERRFIEAVTDTLKEYGIPNESFEFRGGSAFRSEELVGLVGGPQTYRLTANLRFEASPEDTIAIIADLESRPEIEALNQVTLTRSSNRRLSVMIVLEAWVRPMRAPASTQRGIS